MLKKIKSIALFIVLFSCMVNVAIAALDPIENFAKGVVFTGYNASATSIVLESGDGANFPSTFSYNVIWWNATDYPDPSDDPNTEIVRVTGRTTDTLTVTRAQESTSATTKNISGKTYLMMLAFTKKTYDEIAPLASPSFTGNVGIGTVTPDEVFHIEQTDATAGGTVALKLSNKQGEGTYGSIIQFESENTVNASITGLTDTFSSSRGRLVFATANGGGLTDRVTIDQDGNVGIAMIPGGSHELDVTGSAGLSTGTAWTNTSDVRVKRNIITITDGLSKILALRPVEFNYTADYLSIHPELKADRKYHSFVADEYELVFPHAVINGGDLSRQVSPAIEAVPAQAAISAQDAIPEILEVLDIKGNVVQEAHPGKAAVSARPAVKAVAYKEEVRETILTDVKQYNPSDLNMYFVAAIKQLKAEIDILKANVLALELK